MSNFINEYIQYLKDIDEQLYSILIKKRKMQPDFSMSCDYNYVFDTDCKFLFVSLFSIEQNGLNPDDMIGKHWRELDMPHDTMRIIEHEIQGVLSNGKVVKKELSGGYQGRFGKRYFEYTLSPLYGEHKCTEAVLCTVKDITERVISEIKEWDYFSRLNWLIEIAPTAIIIVDNTGKLVNANQTFIDTLLPGFDKNELIGKNSDYAKEIVGLEWIESPCCRALQGEEIRNCYSRVLTHDLLINAGPIKNQEGEIVGAISAFNDITEYEALHKEIVRLDRLNLIGEMATGVAHEIRNPLTVIKGFSQYIQPKVNTDIKSKINLMLEELGCIESIVTDFLSLAKNKQTNRRKQSLNEIIKSVYPLLLADANKQGVDIKLELDENLPEILLDEEQIKQLLLNIARNGVEAMERQGNLTIVSKIQGNTEVLSVANNGPGIPREISQQIFMPFFTTKPNGMGLGLSICESIVERHGGEIQVESEEGVGTSFIIKIPVN